MEENYKNKTIGEFINDSTKILTKFVEGHYYKLTELTDICCMAGPNDRVVVLDYRS